ncbi:MAG: shikimate kinase [Flavobacteriales bacterium]|nr:shikimate kinase [Flavobacteriales bacterium]
MKNIFFIGLPGVGKSFWAKKIADWYGVNFADLDTEIELRLGRPIFNLFETQGEHIFREIEKDILIEFAQKSNVVISVGGGTPCYFENLSVMKQNGVCVYIKDHIESIGNRLFLDKTNRPLFKDCQTVPKIVLKLHELHLKRHPIYSQSHVIIDVESLQKPHLFTKRLELFTKPDFWLNEAK